MIEAVSLLPFASALLSGALALAALARPLGRTAVVRWFFLMAFSAMVWNGAYFVQLNWSSFPDPALAAPFTWEHLLALPMGLGVAGTATYWFLFAAFTARKPFWTSLTGVLLAHVPLIYTVAVGFSNPWHGLFLEAQAASPTEPGPLAAAHYAATFALVLSGAVLLIQWALRRGTMGGRRQALVLGAAVAVPFVAAVLWALREPLGITFSVNPVVILTPLLHAVLAYEVFYRGLGDIIPLSTLAAIMENTDVPLGYVDNDTRFISVNSAFAGMSGRIEGELVGRGYGEVFPGDDLLEAFEDARQRRARVTRHAVPAVLPLGTGETQRFWDKTITPVVDDYGELSGYVISLADVTESIREQQLSRKLNELDERLHASLASEEQLRQAIGEARLAIGAESCSLVVLAERSARMMQKCQRDNAFWEPFHAEEFPHLAYVLDEQTTLVSRDVSADDRLNPSMMAALGAQSVTVIPLLYAGSIRGVLSFEWVTRYSSPSESQIGFAERFASSVAVSIENGRRYENERRIAHTLQESMLSMPDEMSGLQFAHAYQSATEAARVGGDFYDLFELDKGRRGLLIGDVAGHGLEAAVMTSLVKNAVRTQAYEQSSPAAVLAKTNEVIHRQTAPEMFTTAFFAVLDPATGSLTYCSAGHPFSLIVRANGEIVRLTATSPLMGIGRGIGYTEGQERLGPDDLLLMYTDGVTEARRNTEIYGEDRLLRLLSGLRAQDPGSAVSAVFDGVARFSGRRLLDDIALLAVRLAPHPVSMSEAAPPGP